MILTPLTIMLALFGSMLVILGAYLYVGDETV
jgi:hypothetical protein